MKRRFLFALCLCASTAMAQHRPSNERGVNLASRIQKDMLASKYDAGDDCTDLYNKDKAIIQSEIDRFKRTLPKNPPKGSSSEPYTLYAYMLGLKGRCEKDKRSIEEAFNQLDVALKLSIENGAPDEKALGFVAKIINGFMEKSKKGALNGGFGMERAARKTFDRFKTKFEAYFSQVPQARRDRFLGPRINHVYQEMIK